MGIRVVPDGPRPDSTGIPGFTGWRHGVVAWTWDHAANKMDEVFEPDMFDLTTPSYDQADRVSDLRAKVRKQQAAVN